MISTALLSLAVLTATDPLIPGGGAADEVAISGLFGARVGSDDASDPITLDAARMRFFVPTDVAFVQVEVEAASGTPTFLDAYVGTDIRGTRALLGRFETPLTRSRLIERERLLFLDRSLVGAASDRMDGLQLSGRGQRLDWWLAFQDGANPSFEGTMGTARMAVHLIGGSAAELTEGVWGSPGSATLTIAGAFQDDGSYTNGRRAAFEAFWTYDRISAALEVLDNDADVGDSSPWSATGTYLVAPRLEAALRIEDDELVERTTIAVSRYQHTRSSRWCVELGRVEGGAGVDSSTLFQAGVSFSF